MDNSHEVTRASKLAAFGSVKRSLMSWCVGNRYFLVSAAIVSLLFLLIELKYPYYFLQDDNRDFFLPVYVHSYRSLINGGFPLYNFYQFLGYSVFSGGQSGALYPFTYLSVLLSQIIFGNYFAAIDIYVLVHLIIASAGMLFLLKELGLDNRCSLFGSITWTLSSFIIGGSNSWVAISSVAAIFPLVIGFGIRLFRYHRKADFVRLLAAKVLLFYTGFYQYFVYIMIFDFLMLLLLAIKNTVIKHSELVKAAKLYILNTAAVFFSILPLFLPVWQATAVSAERSAKLPFGAFVYKFYPLKQWITGIFNPFGETSAGSMGAHLHLNYLSHIGYLTVVFILICLVWYIIPSVNNEKKSFTFIFIFLGLISLMWATSILFNLLIYLIPVLNRLRWPFKVDLIVDFYLIILASVGFEVLLDKISKRRNYARILLYTVVSIQILNYSVLYVLMPQRSFSYHLDKIPLEEPLKNELSDGRIVTLGFNIWEPYDRNIAGFRYNTAPTLGFNYATLWKLYHFAGYDPLISLENSKAVLGLNYSSIYLKEDIPLDYFRKWGVKWYIVPDKYDVSKYAGALKAYKRDGKRIIYYDSQARTMFFWDHEGQGNVISHETRANSIELKVNNTSRLNRLNFNFLYNRFFKAYIDGRSAAAVKNSDNQVAVDIPKGSHTVVLKYSNPYFTCGIWISFIFLLLLSLYLKFHKERGDRSLLKNASNCQL